MRDTIVQDRVWECDARVVDPSGAIWQYREGKVGALKRRHSNVAKRWRENNIVRDDVVRQNCLECRNVCRLKYGADTCEGLVGWNENGVIGKIESSLVSAGQTKIDTQFSSLQRGINGCVSCSVGKKLKWSSE